MGEFVVSNIGFSDDGVELTFMEVPGDVRNDGRLVRTRNYAVRWDHPSYADELEELRDKARTLVADIDEDWPAAPVWQPADEIEEMGGSPGGDGL